MDPEECYKEFCRALLEEDRETACERYNALRAWMERGGFEPVTFRTKPSARRQFFSFNPSTGQLG